MNRRSRIIHFGAFDFEIISRKMRGRWNENAIDYGKCPHCGDSVSLCTATLWPVREDEREAMKKNFEENAGYYFLLCKKTCKKLVGKATTMEAIEYEQAGHS